MQNLSHEVGALIRAHSEEQADVWMYAFYRSYPEWESSPPHIHQQISQLNDFLRLQLGMMKTNTFKPRRCLVDNITPEAWLANFKNYVLPYILKNKEVPNGAWKIVNPEQ